MDIQNSTDIKKFLEEQNIVYMYIATRDKEVSWNKATEQNKISQNQYLHENGDGANLIDYYDINGIPRYIILNKKHEVVMTRAPKPLVENKNDFAKKVVSLDLISN